MNEEQKNFPEKTSEIDTVTGDNENTENPESKKEPARVHTKMSARTKKRLILLAVVTGVLLLALAAVLITVSVLNNRPPELAEVQERFEMLIEASQDVNEIVWGAGLPTYRRVKKDLKGIRIDFRGNPKTPLQYYAIEDETYGTVIAYTYQARISEGKVDENGQKILTVYDVEHDVPLSKYTEGACRFAQKTKTKKEGEQPIFEKDGYYYYALPKYENPDIAYDTVVYTGREDERYDYVRFDSPYKSTEDVKDAISAVYASAFATPIYQNLFTGVVGAVDDVYQAAYTDYIDESSDTPYLMKSNEKGGTWKWKALPEVTFDYGTMVMLDGNATSVTVRVDYRVSGSDEVKQMEIDFLLENGNWFLNSPTFG